MHRIFIAVNLLEEIRNQLQKIQKKWADLPVRFTKKDSLHLTLFFIGYVDDERMVKICQKVREIGKRHESFVIKFNRICLGPPKKQPRLIWLEGERSEQLINLKRDIGKTLVARENDARAFTEIERESKIFIPHITLARIRQLEWKKLSEKPIIDESSAINVSVNSIEVMESNLRGDGAECIILESAALKS